jgi:hypothetical protein
MQNPDLELDVDDLPLPADERRMLDLYSHASFLNRTHDFFQRQKRRAKAAGQALDYRIEDLRFYVQNNIGARRCNFCCGAVTPEGFAVVQRNPIERGGSFGFHNLVVVCATCGAAKGSLDHFEFRELTGMLRSWSPFVRDYFLARLCAGAGPRLRYPRPANVSRPPAAAAAADFEDWCVPPLAGDAEAGSGI